MKKYFRKFGNFIMAISMVLGLICCSVNGAQVQGATARATTMRLDSYTGKAWVSTMNGATRKIAKGMRLLNGYEVGTSGASYAYINLDDVKAVKLDEKSKVQVRQAGKELDLRIVQGDMFFNVEKSLKKSETFRVRSSSMVAGIRGTSAYVTTNRNWTKLYLIEGTIQLVQTNPQTGKVEKVTIQGGETATSYHFDYNKVGIKVGTFTESELPRFVIDEIAKNKNLQSKIKAKSPLSVNVFLRMKEYYDEGMTQEEVQQQIEEDIANGDDMSDAGEDSSAGADSDTGSSDGDGSDEGSGDGGNSGTADVGDSNTDEDIEVDNQLGELVVDGYFKLQKNADNTATLVQLTDEVVGKNATVTDLVIPKKTSKGYTITSLGQRLLSNIGPDEIKSQNNTVIKSVKIEAEVNVIPADTFDGCKNLQSVTLPDSIEIIDSGAFYGCESLTSLTLPSQLSTIEKKAFFGCKKLARLEYPTSLSEIGEESFYGCTALTKVDLGANKKITTIAPRAFYNCSKLENISFPTSLVAIETSAFQHCESLSALDFTANLAEIDDNAFSGCTALTYVEIPDNVVELNEYAFSDCSENLRFTYKGKSNLSYEDLQKQLEM